MPSAAKSVDAATVVQAVGFVFAPAGAVRFSKNELPPTWL